MPTFFRGRSTRLFITLPRDVKQPADVRHYFHKGFFPAFYSIMVSEGEDFFRGGGESFLVDGRFAGGTAFDEVESETVAA